MKIRPVGVEFLHADGHMDMTKPISAFRDYMIAHYNVSTKELTRSTFLQTFQPMVCGEDNIN
jgi:hypothetical protein